LGFSENLGLFWFVTKQFCLFWLFRYRFETPKQTETFGYWFHETNRNKRETDLVSVCFGSNRKLFLFVSRTPYSGQAAWTVHHVHNHTLLDLSPPASQASHRVGQAL
jgi:hypothetical protein